MNICTKVISVGRIVRTFPYIGRRFSSNMAASVNTSSTCVVSDATVGDNEEDNFKGPRPIVVCGPSGSGKSTILHRLLSEFPATFSISISHTTREPRPGEQHGVHYYFTQRDEMEAMIANDEFIETAVYGNNIYGTSKAAVRDVQKAGKVCILDIEPQGVEQIKKTNLNPVLIYNNPPTLEELERRLRRRGTEAEETIKLRMKLAKDEIAYGLKPGNFHKIIQNVDMDEAYAEFKEYVLKQLKAQEAAGIKICWS